MRTTVNIRDEALELAKQQARERGIPLGEVISEAVLEVFRERPRGEIRERYDLPESGEGGVLPGVDLDNSALLEDIMQGHS